MENAVLRISQTNSWQRMMKTKQFTVLLLAGSSLLCMSWFFQHNDISAENMDLVELEAGINLASEKLQHNQAFYDDTQRTEEEKRELEMWEKEQKENAEIQKLSQCNPVKNVSFAKLHRVGSGSFHNVLVRFAINHGAFVGLANCLNYQVFPLQVSTDLFLPDPKHPKFTGYNMFIDHVLFNRSASDQFLPKDVVYITQIRHPFNEAYSVYEHFWAGRPHVPYDTFLTQPDEYEKPVDILWPCRRTKNYSISRNVMSLELGYTDQSNSDPEKFKQYLAKLDHDFLHVSILELLPESLVMLRHKLCWGFKDLLHLRLHKTGDGSPKENLESVQRKAHREWSPLDYQLYEFFLHKHKREIVRQPKWFKEEVVEFNHVQEKFSRFCSNICEPFAGVDPLDTKTIREIFATQMIFPATRFYETFTTSYEDCAMLQLTELVVKKALKFRMSPGICDTNRKLAHIFHLSCDTENHVIPGLTSRDINDLLDKRRCEMLAYII